MKVRELIEYLGNLEQDREVILKDSQTYYKAVNIVYDVVADNIVNNIYSMVPLKDQEERLKTTAIKAYILGNLD